MAKDKFAMEYAVVCGIGSFPHDMLRYDRCFPAQEVDSYKLDPDHRGHRTLIVARYAGAPGGWTEGRWSSFVWTIRVFKGEFGLNDARAWQETLEETLNITKRSL